MARKTTKYLVGERWMDSWAQGAMFLSYHTEDFSFWQGVYDRDEAKPYTSEADAVKAADAWRAAMRRDGYQPGNTRIMTDPQGPDCEYRPN